MVPQRLLLLLALLLIHADQDNIVLTQGLQLFQWLLPSSLLSAQWDDHSIGGELPP